MRTLNKNTLEKMEEYIQRYCIEKGVSPSYRNIMHSMGMTSLNLVQRYVLALESQGRIKRTNLGNIDTPQRLNKGEVIIAPLVGQIACGQPNFAEENIEESFSLPQGIFGHGKLFMLRAFGNSMIDAGISAGDLLVLRQQDYADEGEIVVALVGEDATLVVHLCLSVKMRMGHAMSARAHRSLSQKRQQHSNNKHLTKEKSVCHSLTNGAN